MNGSGRRYAIALVGCLLVAGSGCNGGWSAKAPADTWRQRSLIEIGERAIDTAEKLEAQELHLGALEAYRRAVWALRYHETLTGTPPLLLAEAEDGVRRLRKALDGEKSPKKVEPAGETR